VRPIDIRDSIAIPSAVIATEPGVSVAAALRSMLAHGVRHLVVQERGAVIGVVSDRALLEKGLREPDLRFDPDLTVAAAMVVMSPVTESTTIQEALADMRRHGAHALPVLRASGTIGLLTESELLNALASSLRGDEALPAVDGETLDAAERSQVMMSNPLLQNALQLLSEAGI
jgi:CBS domain-containing protein